MLLLIKMMVWCVVTLMRRMYKIRHSFCFTFVLQWKCLSLIWGLEKYRKWKSWFEWTPTFKTEFQNIYVFSVSYYGDFVFIILIFIVNTDFTGNNNIKIIIYITKLNDFIFIVQQGFTTIIIFWPNSPFFQYKFIFSCVETFHLFWEKNLSSRKILDVERKVTKILLYIG